MPPLLFNHQLLHTRRTRAHATLAAHDFLHREMANQLNERLAEMQRPFTIAVDISPYPVKLLRDIPSIPVTETPNLPKNHYELVVSMGGLHWVNDVPAFLQNIYQALKPDGLFIALFPGGNTLYELRASLMAAEEALTYGVSARVSPFMDVRDAGALLQRAGFALPVAESDTLTLTYRDAFALCKELRGSGEANALMHASRKPPPRALFPAMAAHYATHFSAENGRIRATVDMLTLTAWKPHASQQQPARRGSGKLSLKEVLR